MQNLAALVFADHSFAVLKAPGAGETAPVNKVTFIFNFFDELRRKVPTGKN